jgi:hypothetical protein
MSKQFTITVHSIAEDGLPDMSKLVGRVAFIFDGCTVSGWPLGAGEDADGPYIGQWEADSDVGKHGAFEGVTHWIEFPVPEWELER